MIQIPLWLYMAVMAAGTGAQMMGQKKVDDERAKAMREERLRREKLSHENEASAEKSKQLFANAQANEDKRAGEIAQQIAPTATPITTAPTGDVRLLDPSSAPSATSTVEQARDMFARGDERSSARAKALAAAGSFGSVFQDYGAGLGRNAQDMDMNSTSMRNWNQNVLPARLEYANQSGREWNTTGDVLKLIGTIMAPMALGGGPGAGAANTTGGVLDQMSGVPKAFAGKDLFGMGSMVQGGGLSGALGAGGMGIASDPRLQELLALQRLGHRLSPDDLAYIASQKNVLH